MNVIHDARADKQKEAEAYAKRSGCMASGGGVKATVKRGIRQHESADHKGEKPSPLSLRSGGKVGGSEAKSRADRYARGGRTKGPAKINIVIATGGGEGERQMAMKQGMQVGAHLGATAAGPKPPMMGPPPGPPMPPPGAAPPPGALPPGGPPPPMMPPRGPMGAGVGPGMMQRGGAVKVPNDAGAGGGKSRLERQGMASEIKVRAHSRRKAGGRV